DLDGDNDIDLVVGVSTSPNGSVMILRNSTPEGGSPDFTAEAPISVGRGIGAVAIGDLNSDGRPDIAALAATDSQINVLIQDETGGFATPVNLSFAAQAIGLAIKDVTGDGIADIVSASRGTPQRFGYLAGHADGTFDPARYFTIGYTPGEFALADI